MPPASGSNNSVADRTDSGGLVSEQGNKWGISMYYLLLPVSPNLLHARYCHTISL